MSTSSDKIASETKNCSFSLQSIERFLALMAIQQTEYSDISYIANGPFALVLRAKKNGIEEVALKALECADHTECQIQAMEREHAIRKQLPSSDYFMAIQDQFFLTEMHENDEQGTKENCRTAWKVYFVQQMEICQGSLHNTIQHYSEQNKDPPSEAFKELLAIQMLDAVNLLHQKHMTHGNITIKNFLLSTSLDDAVFLKLCNFQFTLPGNQRNPKNSLSENESQNRMSPMDAIKRNSLEQDLISLGKVLLQLDNIGSHFDYSKISNNALAQPDLATVFEAHQLKESTLLCKIAFSLLSKSRENNQSARSMLVLLLQKQTEGLKFPLFSVVLKDHVNSLSLPITSQRIMLDFLVWQVSKQRKLQSLTSWFNAKRQRKTQLTVDLLKGALSIMLEWKEFNEVFDVLGVGADGVVFGVENLKEKRKSALKLSLCTNKAETLREIGLRRICQAPHIVKFYGWKFFKDANGNEFVVEELERCKYSLTHHLELQRMYGEYSDEQKNWLAFQMIDSVSFLHENQILHRNIQLGSFLIAENESGKAVVKLGNFSHAVQLQDSYEDFSTLEYQLFERKYQSPVNCILQKHSGESPLYFAPEKWENPDLSTHLTDSFSVGLCIFLLDSQLVCSEEQLARRLLSVPRGSAEICLNMKPQMNAKTCFRTIAKQLLTNQPQQRKFLKNLTDNFTAPFDSKESNFLNLSRISLTFTRTSILAFGGKYILTPLARLVNLQSVALNLYQISIGDLEAQCLLSPLANLQKLSSLTLNLNSNQIGHLGAQSLLSPLANLLNLLTLTLTLNNNSIEDKGAQYLLSPLENLLNLSNLVLNLSWNQIGTKGAQYLLSPLANLLNLSSLSLNLNNNLIGDIGAQSLLCPLANLNKLSSITLNLDQNSIGQAGAQSLLSPLANLFNLSSITLSLFGNQIRDIGAQFLLSPLANLLNLSCLTLDLYCNRIDNKGAQYLLSPLVKLFNLSSITLNLIKNQIGEVGAQSLLTPLANLINLSTITLLLEDNQIGDIGAESLLFPLIYLPNLSNIILNLNNNLIRHEGAEFLLSPLAKLLNLSCLTLFLDQNYIRGTGAQSLLIPLENLPNLTSLTLHLYSNEIKDFGVQSLLSPLATLPNLSNLTLDLFSNQIGDVGAQSLLSPLANLVKLSSINLNLDDNQVGDIGAQSLLSPLGNLLNLSSITINLDDNQIGDIGAQSLLSPLVNLENLSNIILNLKNNQIGCIGAQSLLSPLANLRNLSSITLEFYSNNIGDIGVQSLLSPLVNLPNLAIMTLDLDKNQIGNIGVQSLMYFIKFLSLSTLSLSLRNNNIGDIGTYSLIYPLSNLISLSSLDLQLINISQTKRISHLFKHYFKKIRFLRVV